MFSLTLFLLHSLIEISVFSDFLPNLGSQYGSTKRLNFSQNKGRNFSLIFENFIWRVYGKG